MTMENELTIEALKEKLAKVEIDMRELQSMGDASRKFEVLSEYKAYLQDELAFLKNEKAQNDRQR